MYNTCQNKKLLWRNRQGVVMNVDDMTISHVFYARRMLLKQLPTISQERQNLYKDFEVFGTRISFKALILLISEQMIEEKEKRLQIIAKREADSLFAKAIEEEYNVGWDEDPYYEDVPN